MRDTSPSRRHFLAAAGAALAAPAVLASARSRQNGGDDVHDAPKAQTAGSYAFLAGGATCRLVSDGGFPMNTDDVLGKTPSDEQLEQARRAAFLDQPQIPGHVNTLLVEADGKRLLVDTGCGTGFGPTTGKLLDHLRAAGVGPESIDLVLISHLHPDHVGGLLTPAGAGVFPNATFLISETERSFWSQSEPDLSKIGVPEEFRRQMVQGAQAGLDAMNGRLEDVRPGEKLDGFPAVEVVDAPGHTPGHVALRVGEGGDRLLYITDAVHVQPLQFPNPDWHVAYDADPEQAVKTRREILTRAAESRERISGGHLPFPALAHVKQEGRGFGYVPVLWEWSA